jgi:hypothetical protein
MSGAMLLHHDKLQVALALARCVNAKRINRPGISHPDTKER